MADETEIPVVLRIFADKTGSVNSVLEDTKKRFQGLAGNVADVAKNAAAMSGAVTLAMGGVVAAAVRVAGQFEQLRAKLTATLGDSAAAAQAFQRALEFAATTSFDVQGIVAATVQITAFGQSAERVLPLASNLAAAFGVQVEETALALGKAFSGSLEGFESLRNRFGISNVLLQKFGAELLKTGGISVQTAGDLRKAQDALDAIIRTRFGDATARQAATLFGALSNLGDSIQRVAAQFGQALIPAVTAASRFLTGIIERFESLNPSTREFIAQAALAAVGMGAIVTAGAALVSILASGIGNLVAFAGAVGAFATEAAAASAAGTALAASTAAAPTAAGLAAAGFARLGTAVAGFGASAAAAIGPFGLLALLVGGAATLALRSYEGSVQRADQAVVEQARTLVQSRNAYRDYLDVIQQLTGAQANLAGQAGNVEQFGASVRAALSNLSGIELLRGLDNAGVSLDKLNKDAETNAQRVSIMKDRYFALQVALQKLKALDDLVANSQKKNIDAQVNAENYRRRQQSSILADLTNEQGILAGMPATISSVEAAYRLAGAALGNFLREGEQIEAIRDKYKEFAPVLDEVGKSIERLNGFLRFASKTEDVSALRDTFGLLNGAIAEVEGKLGGLGVPVGNVLALQKELLVATGQEKEDIEGLLGLYDARENITKKVAAGEKKAIDDRIRARELEFEREQVLNGESKAAAVKLYQELLGIVQKGSAEELQILRKLADAKQGLKRKEVEDAKRSLTDLVQSSEGDLESLRATGEATATQTAAALQTVLDALDEWANTNQTLINQQPRLRQEFDQVRASFQKQFDNAKLQEPKELLREAVAAAKAYGTEAVTAEQKRAAAAQARGTLELLLDSGQIKAAGDLRTLQAEINRYKNQELTLTQQIQKEQDKQARETSNVRRQGLEGELELLRAQAEMQGQTPFLLQQIRDKEAQILAEKIQAIREQEQAEIDAGATAQQARERTELRITQLKNEETLKRINAGKQETDAVRNEAQRQEQIRNQFRQNRLGGANSPIISAAERAATENFLGDFRLGQFNVGPVAASLPRDTGPPGALLSRVQAGIARDIQRGEQVAGRGTTGPGARTQFEVAQRASDPQTGVINNNHINVNGTDYYGPQFKQAVETIVRAIERDRRVS